MPAAPRQYAVLGPLTSAVEARAFLGCEVISGAPRSDLPVVIVWLPDDVTRDPKQVSRLQRETAFVTQLKHPNIVRVYGLECFEEGWARVVAFVDGEPLARMLAQQRERGTQLDPRLAGRIMLDVCEGLQHAHEEGQARYAGRPIVHGGIRPDTLFVSYEGATMITGFGASAMAPTQLGASIRDKYAYLAPEQIIGGKATASPATDIYALGAVLIELLTGKPPFADAPDIERAVLTGDPPAIDQPGLVGRLGNVASTALSKRGSDRFESVSAMREAITTAFGDDEPATHDEIAVTLAGLMPIDSTERAGRRQMLESARDPDSVTVLSRPTRAPEGVEANLFEASRPGMATGVNVALDPAEFARDEGEAERSSLGAAPVPVRTALAREENTIVDGRIPPHANEPAPRADSTESQEREEPTAVVTTDRIELRRLKRAEPVAPVPKQAVDEAETEVAEESPKRSLEDERAELASMRGFHDAMTDEIAPRKIEPPPPPASSQPQKPAIAVQVPAAPPQIAAAGKLAAVGGTQPSVPPGGPTALASFPASSSPAHPAQPHPHPTIQTVGLTAPGSAAQQPAQPMPQTHAASAAQQPAQQAPVQAFVPSAAAQPAQQAPVQAFAPSAAAQPAQQAPMPSFVPSAQPMQPQAYAASMPQQPAAPMQPAPHAGAFASQVPQGASGNFLPATSVPARPAQANNGGQPQPAPGALSGTQSFLPGGNSADPVPRANIAVQPPPPQNATAAALSKPAGTRAPAKREESVITAFDRKVGDSSRSTLIVVLGAVAVLLGGIFYFSEAPPEVKENAEEEVRHNLPKDLVRAALEKAGTEKEKEAPVEEEKPEAAAVDPAAAQGAKDPKANTAEAPPVVEKYGRIELSSDPEVDVYDGNDLLGRTPFTIKLESGPHKLRFTDKKTGINTYKNYKIKGGGLQRDHVSFGTSELVVEAPDGASILLNQRFIGKAPLDPVKIYEGKYHLKVTLDGKSWADVFDAPAGRRINYRVTLHD